MLGVLVGGGLLVAGQVHDHADWASRRAEREEEREAAEKERHDQEAERQDQEARRQAEEAERDDNERLTLAITQIAGKKGPAARKTALDAGLARLQLPSTRARLIVEAARMEVAAVLDKVDGLKTGKAKERNLRDALDRLRADEHPDALQLQAIWQLEDALRELTDSPEK